ncbi:MAG: class I SAM-dependent methyltransferase [Chloroflexota bacterium]|nr:class I SAM-dependent methyltransferase [Chloroflexota bacterium]
MSDIFASQPSDAALLAEIYDLEHDEVTEDLVFYREMVARSRGAVADLGCGSGRLFAPFLAGGATRILGVDGSAALLERAAERLARDPSLRGAAEDARIELLRADVRLVKRRDRFAVAVLAGVLSHLNGPEEALRALDRAARLLTPAGRLIVDGVGPGGLPTHDLPLSIDWRKRLHGRDVVRRSELVRHEAPEGLRVLFSTIVDVRRVDGTISRLPASYRLWYPSPEGLEQLLGDVGLEVEATFGSHDLEALDHDSERCIVVAHRAAQARTQTIVRSGDAS